MQASIRGGRRSACPVGGWASAAAEWQVLRRPPCLAHRCEGTVDDPYCEFMVQENKASPEINAGNACAGCLLCHIQFASELLRAVLMPINLLPPTLAAGHWPRVADSRQPVGLLARALDAAACLQPADGGPAAAAGRRSGRPAAAARRACLLAAAEAAGAQHGQVLKCHARVRGAAAPYAAAGHAPG